MPMILNFSSQKRFIKGWTLQESAVEIHPDTIETQEQLTSL